MFFKLKRRIFRHLLMDRIKNNIPHAAVFGMQFA